MSRARGLDIECEWSRGRDDRYTLRYSADAPHNVGICTELEYSYIVLHNVGIPTLCDHIGILPILNVHW